MIGLRFRLEYYDHNERFLPILPREGEITRRLQLEGWDGKWFVLEFDSPIEYENQEHRHAVIASRLVDHELGEPGGVSVFVLLPRDESALVQATPPHTAFDNVVWATAIPVAAV